MNRFFTKKSCLLFLFVPFFLSAQNSSDDLAAATKAFPDDGLVLTESSVHYTFKKEKKSKDIVVVEDRKEAFLSTKGEQNFVYSVHYDDFSEVKSFETTARVNDDYYHSDDIFHSDIRIKYAKYNLRQRGASTAIETSKVFKDVKYLTRVFMTSPQNSLSRKVSFSIPESFEVELVPVNFEGQNIDIKETKVGNNRLIEYQVANLDGYSNASYLPGSTHIYPHILILTKSYKDKNEDKKFFHSVDALYNWYAKLVSEVENEPEQLKEMVTILTKDASSEEEKIKNIFYWVQDHIRYIAFEDGIAGYQPQNCQTVFFNRYGDCKGMANLMKEMLIIAGFDARLVWLGTKSVATDYSTPCLASDNHMICAVKQGEEFLYLDGTEKYTLLGDYAERIQNQEVLIENGEKCIRARIPVQDHLRNASKINLKVTLNEAQELVGHIAMSEKGEAMSRIMYSFTKTPTDEQEEALKKYLAYHDNFTSIKDFKLPEINREMTELALEGGIVIKNKVSSFDDETYVYLDPYQMFGNFDLDEKRKYPLWLSYKHNDFIDIQFDIPEGYEFSSMPEDLHVKNEDFQFDLTCKKEGNSILYAVQVQIPNSEVSSSNIEAWNTAIKELKSRYEQPLVLIKK